MGDRINIRIETKERKNPVYFYCHWKGMDALVNVKRAIAKRMRWNDYPYFCRIVFCELVKKDIDGETGFGIDTEQGDKNHSDIVIDFDNKMVQHDDSKWTFEEIAMEN